MLVRWLSASSVSNANERMSLLAVRLMQFIIKLFLYHCRYILSLKHIFFLAMCRQRTKMRLHFGNDSSIITRNERFIFTTFVFNQLESNSFTLIVLCRCRKEAVLIESKREIKCSCHISVKSNSILNWKKNHPKWHNISRLLYGHIHFTAQCNVMHWNEYWLHNFWVHFEMGFAFPNHLKSTLHLIWWNVINLNRTWHLTKIDLTCVISWFIVSRSLKCNHLKYTN